MSVGPFQHKTAFTRTQKGVALHTAVASKKETTMWVGPSAGFTVLGYTCSYQSDYSAGQATSTPGML